MRAQVQQKDVGRRLQVGQELLEYLRDPAASPDVEQDPQRLDKVIDELAAWVNSSNFKVREVHFRKELQYVSDILFTEYACPHLPPPPPQKNNKSMAVVIIRAD
uniref:Uncharacterized protein n=1 Tax=Anas platyrhynchos platyrhynchos TaxID=8840 RepID=A0A493T4K0_ANAPP